MSFELPFGGKRSSDLVYQSKHHGDTVFNNSYFERLYIWNDECDGLIWKKEHNNDLIICGTSWYPGSYASTSYASCAVHPADSKKNNKEYSYITNGGAIGGQAIFKRTKDFVIASTRLYYYKYYADYRISKDGIHWKPWIGGIPAQWGDATGSWSVKENLGLTTGSSPDGRSGLWRMEIDSHGDLTMDLLTTDGASLLLGDIAGMGIEVDGIHEWYKFMDVHGRRYVSQLPNKYSYTDDRETDPMKKVKWATYSWAFKYLNGKYYAATMKGGSIYWNPVKQEWQQLRSFIIVESSDGFRNITPHYVMDPCPYIYYQSWDYFYFNKKLLIMEWGREHEEDQTQYLKIRDINNNVLGHVIEKVRMPFVGMARDGSYDALDFYFHGTAAESNRVCVRGYGGGLGGCIYIKDGKPTEPYGSIIIPTAFRKNGWSSGSYDCGGFIFIRGKENDSFFTQQPKEAFAFCSDVGVADRDGATWGDDKYKLSYIGDANTIVHGIEEDVSHYTYAYTDEFSPTTEWQHKYFRFHLDHVVTPYRIGKNGIHIPLTNKRRKLRHVQTVIDFRDREFNVESEYYYPYAGAFTSFGGRSFEKVEAGKSYGFAVYLWSGNYTATCPLCISNDEFVTVHNIGGWGGQNNDVQTVEYGGMLWYYCGFGYGLYANYTDADRYIDVTPLGRVSNEKIVLECLKRAHPLPE